MGIRRRERGGRVYHSVKVCGSTSITVASNAVIWKCTLFEVIDNTSRSFSVEGLNTSMHSVTATNTCLLNVVFAACYMFVCVSVFTRLQIALEVGSPTSPPLPLQGPNDLKGAQEKQKNAIETSQLRLEISLKLEHWEWPTLFVIRTRLRGLRARRGRESRRTLRRKGLERRRKGASRVKRWAHESDT